MVINCWRFAHARYDNDCKVFDRTNQRTVAANVYFLEKEWGWYVRRDNLPFDLNVKGVLLRNDGKLRMEMTGIDFPRLALLLEHRPELKQMSLTGRRFLWDGTPLIQTTTKNVAQTGSPIFRTLVGTMVRLQDLDDPAPIVDLADLIYNFNCFREDSIPRAADEHASPTGMMVMQQRTELRQVMAELMVQEQVMRVEQLPVTQHRLARVALEVGAERLPELIQELGVTPAQFDAMVGGTLRAWAIRKIQRVQPNLSYVQAQHVFERMSAKRK